MEIFVIIGAVPIFLALLPVISPGPVTVELFNKVFVTVIASPILQGWTIPLVLTVSLGVLLLVALHGIILRRPVALSAANRNLKIIFIRNQVTKDPIL